MRGCPTRTSVAAVIEPDRLMVESSRPGKVLPPAIAPSQKGVYFVDDAGSGPGANSLRLLF